MSVLPEMCVRSISRNAAKICLLKTALALHCLRMLSPGLLMSDQISAYWEKDIAELAGSSDESEEGREEEVEEAGVPEPMEPGDEKDDDIEAKALGIGEKPLQVVRSERLRIFLQLVNEKVQSGRAETLSPIESEEEYQLIVRANKFSAEIEDEINELHKRIKEIYGKKFPELESIIFTPADYVKVVKAIGNATDISGVNLQGILTPTIIMTINMTASVSLTKLLPPEVLAEVLQGCDDVLSLEDSKTQILAFVESRMQYIAPNLSALLGPNIAAKLMAAAGGLDRLSRIAACNMQILGAKKKHSAGFSSSSTLPHTGFLFYSAIVQQAPMDLRMKASRVLAGRVALCSRMDYFHEEQAGAQGQLYKEEILKKIEKWQEPPPPKQIKPLTAPILIPKKKRGGKRARKIKEKTAMTEIRKFQNRMKFGEPEPEFRETGKGFGMLGLDGTGAVRLTKSKQQLKVSKKMMKGVQSNRPFQSGLATSLAFTPVQGIELEDPNARAEKSRTHERYFSITAPLTDRKKPRVDPEPG